MVSKNFWEPLTISEWKKTEDFKKLNSVSTREFVEVWFNRMPIRVAYQKPNWIYAPFDGIVTHIGLYDPTEDMFDVKGGKYTINEILDRELQCKCYVCGIFLTAFSVHLGRFPVTGYLRRIDWLPSLLTANDSMIAAEAGLLKNKIEADSFKFAYRNETKIYEIYDFLNGLDVVVVSVADKDVDALLDFCREGDVFHQGQRMQFVCWGSYGLLIVPQNKPFELLPKVEAKDYVFAGKTVIFAVKESSNGKEKRTA